MLDYMNNYPNATKLKSLNRMDFHQLVAGNVFEGKTYEIKDGDIINFKFNV